MYSRIIIDRHVPIPMRDGTLLHADIYRPDTTDKVPVILSRTPYEKGGLLNFSFTMNPIRAVEYGYAVVFQDVRGRWMAEGNFYPYRHEIDDGYDSVEWLAAQPWCSGEVGMVGGSYIGATQWLAALAQPPHLKAIVPKITTSNYYGGWTYQGGAFELGFILSWTIGSLATDTARRMGKSDSLAELLVEADRFTQYYDYLPLKSVPILRDSEAAHYYFDWLDHPTYDDYWKPSALKERYGDVQVPALNVGGWHDLFLGGTLENFTRMQREGGSETARKGQRLLIGPWSHGVFTGLFPDHNYGAHSGEEGIDHTMVQLRYFDYFLKGIDNGVDTDAPVRLFIMGTNEWRNENEWPLARTQYTPWYLHGDGRSALREGILSPNAPADEPPDAYLYDPANPTPSIGGPTLHFGNVIGVDAGPKDQRSTETRPDVLVFSSDVLTEPVEVTGPLKVVLYAATSAPDTDFVAKLTDVFPDGASKILNEGIIRARYRQGTDAERPITPGEVYEYTIDVIATSNVFLPGHRIRLDICSASFPRFDRNLNSGKPHGTDTLDDAIIARQTIYHDSARPSHILLPIIPQA
jgi:putative CocE/NonD family hydrolase